MKKFNGSNFYTQEVKVQMNLMHQTTSIWSGSNRATPAHLFMKLICMQKATKAQSNQTNSDFLPHTILFELFHCIHSGMWSPYQKFSYQCLKYDELNVSRTYCSCCLKVTWKFVANKSHSHPN